MTRILLILFGYGVLLIGLSYGVAWGFSRWREHEETKSHARSDHPSGTRN